MSNNSIAAEAVASLSALSVPRNDELERIWKDVAVTY
jgi:hypothetical protein